MDAHSDRDGLAEFIAERFGAHEGCMRCPSPRAVAEWFDELLGLLLPERSGRRYGTKEELGAHLFELRARLTKLLAAADPGGSAQADRVAEDFTALLPELSAHIVEDVIAIERGDPAATSAAEVARTYPGVFAVAAYRVAHALHRLGVPLLPRIVSAHAHGATGIDIHPAARIGRHFCIDHGTGVVIGATAVIGERVKIYQGVTLGGLSVRKEDAAIKRHPTIEDDVVIYAGATILGGETVIGRGTVVGGNVWVTRSVPPGSRLSYRVEAVEAGVARDAASDEAAAAVDVVVQGRLP